MAIPLTPTAIGKLRPNGKRQEIRFTGAAAKGLLIRMSTAGDMVWNFHKRIPAANGGGVYRATLGPVRVLPNGKVDPTGIDAALIWTAQQRDAVEQARSTREAKRLADGPVTMERLWQEYLEGHAKLFNKPSTIEANQRIWHLHIAPEFSQMKVESLTRVDVTEFYHRKFRELEGSSQSATGGMANNILALLSKLMNFAIERSYREGNPCAGIKKIKTKKPSIELTETDRRALLSAAEGEGREMLLIVHMALATGMRKQEILKARWEHLREPELHIPDAKAGERRIKLPEELLRALRDWRSREAVVDRRGSKAVPERSAGWIFPSTASKYEGRLGKDGKALSPFTPEHERPPREDVKMAWGRIREKAGLPSLRLHDLRHDFGTRLAMDGAKPYELMGAMGHTSIETTMVYINRAKLAREQGNIAALSGEGLKGALEGLGENVIKLK